MTEKFVELTRQEVCQALHCSDRKFAYMLEKNQFPAGVRHGKQDLWSAKALENWRRTQFAAQEAWRPIQAR